jgi:hypothetical protein
MLVLLQYQNTIMSGSVSIQDVNGSFVLPTHMLCGVLEQIQTIMAMRKLYTRLTLYINSRQSSCRKQVVLFNTGISITPLLRLQGINCIVQSNTDCVSHQITLLFTLTIHLYYIYRWR